MRLLVLDAHGRTLAYGSGTGTTKLLSVCPRGGRAVEVVDGRPERVAVRDVRTLSVVRETPLPAGNFAANVHCRDAAARDVYVFAKRQAGGPPGGPSGVLHVRAGHVQERYRGSADSSVFRGRAVYLNEGIGGRDVVRVDLDSGERRLLVTAAARMNHLSLSPRATRVAGIDFDPSGVRPVVRLVLLELEGQRGARTVTLASPWFSGKLTWLDETRLAVLASRRSAEIFDRRLRRVGVLRRWRATDAVVSARSAYGLVAPVTPFGQAWLQAAPLPNGVARRLRHFPGAGAVVIAALRPQRRAFCLAAERVFPGA